MFALFIWNVGTRHPECIKGVTDNSTDFVDSFALSWTTFSTCVRVMLCHVCLRRVESNLTICCIISVQGYGAIYSGLASQTGDLRKCAALTAIVSTEAFIGLLFASMCSAIIFIKVSRVQSFAQVDFCDPICIRYGSGVKVECDDDGKDSDGSESTHDDHYPCPMLEFRVVNRMNRISGGEILDATVNVVATIDAAQACPSVFGSASYRRRGKKGKKIGRQIRRPLAGGKFPSTSRPVPQHASSVSSSA